MTIADIRSATDTKMDQSIAAFQNNLTKIRTGRANPALLDSIHVDYYGSTVPLSQVANVSVLDSRTISVQPWEKGMGAKIEKAMAKANKIEQKQLKADQAAMEKDAKEASK
jgi:ribosome recycling factor